MVNIPRWLLWSARSIGILLALTTMVYAGLLLISMIAIDVWSTWLLPLLFVVSSLSCGLAATLFMEPYFSGPKSKTEPTFWRIQPLLGVLEFVVLITFIGERMGFSQTAQGSIESLILGNYAVAFWLGVVLLGLLMPLLIHILYRKIPIKALVQVSSVGVLTGGFFLRFCVVGIGLYAPLFPGS
jgi:formate-dependent nitrite reductase membrane component NrfD